MRIHHFISIVGVCVALFGCATPQPTKDTPGAVLKPEDILKMDIPSTNTGDLPPKLIRAINAVYPFDAKKNGITGVVVVQFIVNQYGKVVSPTVIKSPNPLLSKAAVDAISQWEFLPGVKGEKIVPVKMQMPVTFSIDTKK
ncbi:MAG TPA: energy transducer TonB [Opitutaceae bacterium]|jgi:TonB family protein|nr:energy transducer TonB [Opitutaceae bacterium]